MTEKPSQLATRYLMTLWQKQFTGVPPLDLTQSVVTTVVQVGYARKLVDTMFQSYIKANKLTLE